MQGSGSGTGSYLANMVLYPSRFEFFEYLPDNIQVRFRRYACHTAPSCQRRAIKFAGAGSPRWMMNALLSCKCGTQAAGLAAAAQSPMTHTRAALVTIGFVLLSKCLTTLRHARRASRCSQSATLEPW